MKNFFPLSVYCCVLTSKVASGQSNFPHPSTGNRRSDKNVQAEAAEDSSVNKSHDETDGGGTCNVCSEGIFDLGDCDPSQITVTIRVQKEATQTGNDEPRRQLLKKKRRLLGKLKKCIRELQDLTCGGEPLLDNVAGLGLVPAEGTTEGLLLPSEKQLPESHRLKAAQKFLWRQVGQLSEALRSVAKALKENPPSDGQKQGNPTIGPEAHLG